MKKILLISTNALGDTYLVCSVLKTLRHHFEKSQIDIISSESARFFLNEAGFDNLYLIKRKSFSEVHRIIFKIRNTGYDFVFNFFPGQMNTSLFKLSKADEKIGFVNIIKKKSWHNDEDTLRIKSQPKNKAAIWKPEENYLQRMRLALNYAGIKNAQITKHIFDFEDEACGTYDIVAHFFSSDANRQIGEDSIKEILNELCITNKKKVCLIGSKDELKKIKGFVTVSGLHFEESPGIKKLVSLIKNCKLYIGVDSFPLHIADAYGVKTLGIFYYKNEKSVFQNMDNKFIFRTESAAIDTKEFFNFIKKKQILSGIN
ncbi:MAG: glycosyltransferase family 9 protein [Bacteroidetes bacterium]|nr:glycosyltransferase family 9 protein [Bacteroidota bacterium]